MIRMACIVTYQQKRPSKRPAKPAKTLPIVTPVVRATESGKRLQAWGDDGEPGAEGVKAFVRRMMPTLTRHPRGVTVGAVALSQAQHG
jgi:hypothetical protein